MERREVLAGIGLFAMMMGASRHGLAHAAGVEADDPYLKLVHPDLREGARAILARQASEPVLAMDNLQHWRDGMNRYYAPALPDVPHESRTVPGLAGQGPVGIELINFQPGRAPRPAILHTHGGGFIIGRASGAVHDIQQICRELDCVGVSVEYRLAPEATYRESLEDNYSGLKWLLGRERKAA